MDAARDRDHITAWGFVAAQGLFLAAVLFFPKGTLWTTPAWLRVASVAVEWAGLVLVGVGLVNLGRSLTALPTPVERGELKTGGLYRFVRHPVYTGNMAFALGIALRSGSLAVVGAGVGLTVWLAVKARWEERRLQARYPGYAAYAARTPRFIPGRPVRGR